MHLLIFTSKFVFVLFTAFVLGNLFGVYGILASDIRYLQVFETNCIIISFDI